MALLLVALAAYWVALEIGTYLAVSRIFGGQRVQRDDQCAALALRPLQQGRKTVLVVGNSLLRASVDRAVLPQALAPEHSVSVFPVDYSAYWDWYFGLRYLFARGAHPSVVVVSLNTEQLLSDSTVGERFAHTMLQLGDLPRVTRAAGLDMNTASNYFFARWSNWLGGRWHIRNWILAQWLPDAAALTGRFAPKRKAPTLSGAVAVQHTIWRLRALQQLVENQGARFVFLIPPSIDIAEPALQIQRAAQAEGISVLLPYAPGELPPNVFSDGFHLNTAGAALYGERLWPSLQQALLLEHVPAGPAVLRTSQ